MSKAIKAAVLAFCWFTGFWHFPAERLGVSAC